MLRELEILVDGDHHHAYLLQIFLKEAAGLYGDPTAGPVLLRDHPAQGRPRLRRRQLPRAVREHRARAARARSASDARPHAASATSPRKHHIQLRGADGELRFEECFTRDGFDGPYTILYHLRRPHTQRLAPAQHGWAAPVAARRARAREAPLPDRRARASRAARRSTRASPLLFNADLIARRRVPDAPTIRSTSPTATPTSSSTSTRAAARCASLLGDLAFAQGDYVFVPRGLLHRFLPDAATQHWFWFSLDRRPPPAEAVAQRGRPAPHGRAVLRTATSSARASRRRATRASASWSCARDGALARLHARGLAARRRRLGRHGLSVGVPDPRVPAARRARCTCRRRGTARSPRAAR